MFLGQHVFENWTSVTGGLNGTPVAVPAKVGPVDFADLRLFGHTFTRDQGYLYMIWAVVALVALTSKNLTRSRAGRAMQAVRDRDAAAEAIGIHLAHTKVLAFVVSGSLAALAGALLGTYQQYVAPDGFSLFLSLQYIAMIVVGGVGTTFGPILGALFITAVPRVIEEFSDKIPGVAAAGGKGITVFSLNQAIFGLLIIAFLAPRAAWHRRSVAAPEELLPFLALLVLTGQNPREESIMRRTRKTSMTAALLAVGCARRRLRQ